MINLKWVSKKINFKGWQAFARKTKRSGVRKSNIKGVGNETLVNELYKTTTKIFGVEILMICNWWNKKDDINVIKVPVFCFVLLIFI